MTTTESAIEVRFAHSKQRSLVSVDRLEAQVVDFLEHHCAYPLVDVDFAALVEGVTGEEKLASLLKECGYANDPGGFLQALVKELEHTSCLQPRAVAVGGVRLPYQLLLAVLEVLVPGRGFKTVKDVRQLEELTNTIVPAEERDDLQRVIDLYPVRFSWHTIRQMRLSPFVARQYRPFVGELDEEGDVHTWVGQFFRGIVEQMYQNRVIFIMNMGCPVYCRFCFRKHKECRTQKSPTKPHVKQAVLYIANDTAVKEIVLTGGDPFMNRATLQHAVTELAKIPHVQTLRLASRAVSYYPEMFLDNEGYWLNYLLRTNLDLKQRGKRLELATHFLHPDEISVDALHVISHLVRGGVPVYVQTPFVKGCNESGRELVPLYNMLRSVGAEIHYIFMPTSPIQGNSTYWTSISEGLGAARYLRAHLSDRAMPHITTATSIGKIDWNSSGWAVERKEDDPDYVWIRTPYNEAYYEEFAPIMQLSDHVRSNLEGTLDAAFRVEVGDDALLAGPHGLSSSSEAFAFKLEKTAETVANSLAFLQARCLEDQRDLETMLGARPCACLARPQACRAEIDCGAPAEQIDAACDFLGAHPEITDVVLSRADDVLSGFSRNLEVLEKVRRIPSVLAIRLRSLELNYQPESFRRAAIVAIAARNRLHVVRPTRLEIETQFLHSSEFRPEHAKVARELRSRGVSVYNNTPLLGYINDNQEEMLRISSACREAGIEFCNLYVAGLAIQREWNEEFPIELNSVIHIATHVRCHGSGREVPRYLLRTALGEVDFGIAPRIFEPAESEGGAVRVRLPDQRMEYFEQLSPGFSWPEGVTLGEDGSPLVPVPGIQLAIQGFLSTPTEPDAD